MTEKNTVELDVRPILAAKQEPFKQIMDAIDSLKKGDMLILHAPFKPSPLIKILGKKGYQTEAFHEDKKHWKIHFWKEDVSND